MIELSRVQVSIGRESLGDFSFAVPAGRYAVLMGPTGIGKTTVLELICGLRPIQKGTIRINDRDVAGMSPAARNIGYVPQDLALFPHLTVHDHLAFALRLRGETAQNTDARVHEVADWLSITQLLSRGVAHLSGGEAQRVALGRALSFRPSVLLLDEPLSALDERSRTSAQEMLANMNAQTNVTVLHVTHNSAEAAALADVRIDLTRDAETGKVLVQQKTMKPKKS